MVAAIAFIRPYYAHVQHPTHIVIVYKADVRTRWYFNHHRPR